MNPPGSRLLSGALREVRTQIRDANGAPAVAGTGLPAGAAHGASGPGAGLPAPNLALGSVQGGALGAVTGGP